MKYYAVIDTNVLVSAMLRYNSVPGYILEHTFVGDIIPLLNMEILKEYRAVLSRPKFHFEKDKIDTIIDGLLKRGIFVDAETLDIKLPDPKDAVFYEIVMEQRKTNDAFLITGNIKHFPIKPYIVTPREMLTIIEKVV